MRHYDKLQSLGQKLAKREATERIAKWKRKMNIAWSASPRDIYAWIKDDSSAPLLMLKDPDTREPTSNVDRMDSILHEAWDKVTRKYADQAEPDPEIFLRKYAPFFWGGGRRMQTTPLTGARPRKRFRKMGLRTSTRLVGECVADLLCLPDVLLNWLAELLTVIEQTGRWPRILARGFISLIPKGEGMLLMQQRPLSVLSQIYRVWAGVRLEECMTWQETWIHPQAYGFRKKRGATDAAGMVSLLIELYHVMQTTLMGFGLDYVKCFDLIPQQVVLLVAKE